MNSMTQTVRSADIGVDLVEDPSALRVFVTPECAATVWHRHTPPEVQTWLDGVPPDALPKCREILPPQEIADMLLQLFDTNGLPIGPERDWLLNDIVSLADVFSNLMRAKFLRLRLDVVTTNACRKFHVDALSARLVCTYRGTGTQYGLSAGNGDPAQVFTVGTGAPILLRGTHWPAQPPSGLLHRSPPIEGSGETRLVLVLDPIPDPDAVPEC